MWPTSLPAGGDRTGLGTFVNAGAFKSFLGRLFSLPFLKRWKAEALRTGDDIVATSHMLKGKNLRFWLKAVGSTLLAWLSLFLISVFIFMAFLILQHWNTWWSWPGKQWSG